VSKDNRPPAPVILGLPERLMADTEVAAASIFIDLEKLHVRYPDVHQKVIGKLIDAGHVAAPRCFLA
jgi:hypothetical protein